MAYQGHKNRNAWNVALYLANEEPLYRLCQREISASRNSSYCGRRNLDAAAEAILAALPAKTPDGVPYTRTNVRAALVGWEG